MRLIFSLLNLRENVYFFELDFSRFHNSKMPETRINKNPTRWQNHRFWAGTRNLVVFNNKGFLRGSLGAGGRTLKIWATHNETVRRTVSPDFGKGLRYFSIGILPKPVCFSPVRVRHSKQTKDTARVSFICWSWWPDSNRRPAHYETAMERFNGYNLTVLSRFYYPIYCWIIHLALSFATAFRS